MAIGDMMGMMKQAKELQARMAAVQKEAEEMKLVGAAGGGLVKVTMDGKAMVKAVSIDPSLIKPEEAGILEDLILAACKDARLKVELAIAERMREATGGLQLPPGLTPSV